MNILNSNFEMRDYLRIFWRRKWYFILSFMLVIAAGIFFLVTRMPEYESFCVIQIKTSRLPSSLQRVVPGVTDYQRYVSLKKQIINSKSLLKLIERLKLTERGAVQKAALAMQKDMPDKGLDEISRFLLIKDLKKNTSVRTGNNYVEIKITSNTSESAFLKVKTLTDIFMEEFFERELANVQIIKDFNYQQMEIFKKKLEKAEKKLNKYKQELLVNQNIKNEILNDEALRRINEAIVAVEITTKAKKDYLSYIKDQLRLKGQTIIEEPPKTPVINNLHSEIEMKIDQMADLMKRYSWKSSELIKVNKNINNLRNKIKDEIEKYYRNYFPELDVKTLSLINDNAISLVDLDMSEKKKEVLYQVVETSKYNTSLNNANELTLTKFEEKVDVNRNLYSLFLEQIQGTQIEEAIQQANESSRFNILEPPIEALEPTNADFKMKLMLTLFFALISGIGAVYLRESLNKSIRTVDEAEETFQIPVLGILPYLENEPLLQSNHQEEPMITEEEYNE